MPDPLTPQQRHTCMSHIRSKNTKPEMSLRKGLFAQGYRYRINVKTLPGTPDIVLPKYHTAIFVNGCFWHGHKGCKLYTVPETNREFWQEKVRRNRERDEIDIQRLESLSWSVVTVWECELKPKMLADTLARVTSELQANRQKWIVYDTRRRADRSFSRAESRRKKALLAEIEKELREQFDIPARIVRLSMEEGD